MVILWLYCGYPWLYCGYTDLAESGPTLLMSNEELAVMALSGISKFPIPKTNSHISEKIKY